MSRHIVIALALLFLAAVPVKADTDTELRRMLIDDSHQLELDDGGASPMSLTFASVHEADGSFRAWFRRPTGSVQVSGRFTFVPEFWIRGTNWRVPAHYRMVFYVSRFVSTTTYAADLYPTPDEPLLMGRGSYATAGLLYTGSRTPVLFTAER